jgi:diguanylate cyclase (GGDEF)-like protein
MDKSQESYASVGLKLGMLVTGMLTLVFVVAAVWFNKYAQKNLDELMHRQAAAMIQQIVLMRHWNASYRGVYVLKRPGIETNSYLYKVGPGEGKPRTFEPEITDTAGNVYTLKNPALMTRELSELTAKNAEIRFHLTSLKLINPNNRPDSFEEKSLLRFEQGIDEASVTEQNDGKTYYRLMKPLRIEEGCLGCHGFQGYKVGDIRGGISLSIPVDQELSVLMHARQNFALAAAVLLILVALLIVWGMRRIVTVPVRTLQEFATEIGQGDKSIPASVLSRHDEVGLLARELKTTNEILLAQHRLLNQRNQELEMESRTDALTGLFNRRHFFTEGAQLFEYWQKQQVPAAILMIDIDYFKSVNDTYGHQVGDQVLQEVAQVIRSECRPHDMVVRYGGEEFAVMLQASAPGSGATTAERIKQAIGAHPVDSERGEILLTASFGVLEGNALGNFESAISKADRALYEAKHAGRNRVVVYTENFV